MPSASTAYVVKPAAPTSWTFVSPGTRVGDATSSMPAECPSCPTVFAPQVQTVPSPRNAAKWTLPALHAIGRGPARFGEIASRLTGITDRALALSLRDLQHESLVLRDVHDGRPPFAAYNPSPNARRLSPILNRLRAA